MNTQARTRYCQYKGCTNELIGAHSNRKFCHPCSALAVRECERIRRADKTWGQGKMTLAEAREQQKLDREQGIVLG